RIALHGLVTPVQTANEIERIALEPGINPGRARHIQDRIALVAEANACVNSGQKPAGPIGGAAADPTSGRHYDKRRQIAALGTDAIRHPGANAGPSRLTETGVEKNLG